jgi:tetratricopeptide (TPR) repeat protein
MRWDQTEYILKGLYLGLLVVVALTAYASPDDNLTWASIGVLAATTAGGLVMALGWAAVRKVQGGVSAAGHTLGFILFLLLENPRAVFTGVIGGLMAGVYFLVRGSESSELVIGPALGGVVLGLALWGLRNLRDAQLRNYLGLALAAALVGGAAAALWFYPLPPDQQIPAGALLLLGIPGFYLLTFASFEEETEVEIAALCGALGVGLWALAGDSTFRSAAFVVPLLLYYTYTRYVLPGLRVFKHALRGLSFRQVGQIDRALASLGRALQLSPQHPLAREQLWELHRDLDYAKIKDHPTILKLVNYPLCLERVASLLLADAPQPKQIQESLHLLELVANQRPDLEPSCWYWRAVAACHQRDFDEAEKNLGLLLAGEAPAEPRSRRGMLFAGWQLALLLHPEMQRRVGPLVERPARRFEAIAAAERELAVKPDDPAAWDMKRLLYAPLTEAMYLQQTPEGKIREEFDYGYVQQLGLALIDDKDQWPRGCEFLRIAARGLPASAATLYTTIAKAHEKFGDVPGMWANYQKAMQVGRAVGVANMTPADRQSLFTVVKQVGERAMVENQLDAALDAFKFYSEKDEAGIETYRTLAELFERKTDPWTALNCTEHALTYNSADPDLVARKDRYTYSVTPQELKDRWDSVQRWFDVDYCRTKANFLLDKAGGNLDLVDWAGHLAELYGTAKPTSLDGLVLRARVRRLRGEIPETIELLEKVRQNKPEKFGSEQEEDAWFVAHRLLGDLYLGETPAEAVKCFLEFRKSSRAGADTMYKLGRAYEGIGDFPRAARCFEEVTTFSEHPLYYDARDALARVRSATVRG